MSQASQCWRLSRLLINWRVSTFYIFWKITYCIIGCFQTCQCIYLLILCLSYAHLDYIAFCLSLPVVFSVHHVSLWRTSQVFTSILTFIFKGLCFTTRANTTLIFSCISPLACFVIWNLAWHLGISGCNTPQEMIKIEEMDHMHIRNRDHLENSLRGSTTDGH